VFRNRLDKDPTFLSLIDEQYEADITTLLSLRNDKLPAGIDLVSLSVFREANGNAIFYCRYKDCSQAISGFTTLKAREQHESSHMLRLQCDVPYCAWEGVGFRRPRDLKSHKQKHHSSLDHSKIPEISSLESKWPGDQGGSFPTHQSGPQRVGNELANLNPDDLSPEQKRVGSDWFAVFNPDLPRVLDVQLLHNLLHESAVCCVRFSQNGKYVATGCDRSAQIYDVNTGQEVCKLQDDRVDKEGDLYIRSVCFSPDGRCLATGAEDRLIRVSLVTSPEPSQR
jgi:WD40 repeat protein